MNARDQLRTTIRAIVAFAPADEAVLLDAFRPRALEAGAHLLDAGQRCREVCFVHRGLLRTALLTGAHDVTVDFRGEGEFVTDYVSVLTAAPSAHAIIALEPCELMCLPRERMLQLYDALPGADRLGRRIAEALFVATVQRSTSLQTLTPADRYARFVTERGDLAGRVPQYLLASYLGVTPESLSRIRRRLTSARRQRAARRRRS